MTVFHYDSNGNIYPNTDTTYDNTKSQHKSLYAMEDSEQNLHIVCGIGFLDRFNPVTVLPNEVPFDQSYSTFTPPSFLTHTFDTQYDCSLIQVPGTKIYYLTFSDNLNSCYFHQWEYDDTLTNQMIFVNHQRFTGHSLACDVFQQYLSFVFCLYINTMDNLTGVLFPNGISKELFPVQSSCLFKMIRGANNIIVLSISKDRNTLTKIIISAKASNPTLSFTIKDTLIQVNPHLFNTLSLVHYNSSIFMFCLSSVNDIYLQFLSYTEDISEPLIHIRSLKPICSTSIGIFGTSGEFGLIITSQFDNNVSWLLISSSLPICTDKSFVWYQFKDLEFRDLVDNSLRSLDVKVIFLMTNGIETYPKIEVEVEYPLTTKIQFMFRGDYSYTFKIKQVLKSPTNEFNIGSDVICDLTIKACDNLSILDTLCQTCKPNYTLVDGKCINLSCYGIYYYHTSGIFGCLMNDQYCEIEYPYRIDGTLECVMECPDDNCTKLCQNACNPPMIWSSINICNCIASNIQECPNSTYYINGPKQHNCFNSIYCEDAYPYLIRNTRECTKVCPYRKECDLSCKGSCSEGQRSSFLCTCTDCSNGNYYYSEGGIVTCTGNNYCTNDYPSLIPNKKECVKVCPPELNCQSFCFSPCQPSQTTTTECNCIDCSGNNYYYNLSLGVYTCTNSIMCTDDYPFLIDGTRECVKKCLNVPCTKLCSVSCNQPKEWSSIHQCSCISLDTDDCPNSNYYLTSPQLHTCTSTDYCTNDYPYLIENTKECVKICPLGNNCALKCLGPCELSQISNSGCNCMNCPNGYYFLSEEGVYTCTNTNYCTIDYPYLIPDTKQCVNACTNDKVLPNKYPYICYAIDCLGGNYYYDLRTREYTCTIDKSFCTDDYPYQINNTKECSKECPIGIDCTKLCLGLCELSQTTTSSCTCLDCSGGNYYVTDGGAPTCTADGSFCTDDYPYLINNTKECVKECPIGKNCNKLCNTSCKASQTTSSICFCIDCLGGNFYTTATSVLTCTPNSLFCINEYPFLITNTNECLEKCPIDQSCDKLCKTRCKPIQTSTIECECDSVMNDNEKKKVIDDPAFILDLYNPPTIIHISNATYEIYSHPPNDINTNKPSNISNIKEEDMYILREKCNIQQEEQIIVHKKDIIVDQRLVSNVTIKYYYMDGNRIDLDKCENMNISLTIPILNVNDDRYKQGKEMFMKDINLYQVSDSFFNDFCYKFQTANKTDITQKDKVKYYLMDNSTLCPQGFIYKIINYTTNTAECEYETKPRPKEKKKDTFKAVKYAFINGLLGSNWKVVTCYQHVINIHILLTNWDSWTMIILFILSFIIIILFARKKKLIVVFLGQFNITKGNIHTTQKKTEKNNNHSNNKASTNKPIIIKQKNINHSKTVKKAQSKNKTKIEYDSWEMEKDRIKLDKRNVFQHYWDFLRNIHPLIYLTIKSRKVLTYIKMSLFLINQVTDFSLSAFFYCDSYISKNYIGEGNFLTDLPVSIYSYVFASIPGVLFNYLTSCESTIEKIEK